MQVYSKVAKRGCPVCEGKHVRKCTNCHGKTWLFDYYMKDGEWVHLPNETKR